MKVKMQLLNFLVIFALLSSSICFKSVLKLNNPHDLYKNRHGKVSDHEKEECLQPEFISEDVFDYIMETLKNTNPNKITKTIHELLKMGNGAMFSPTQTLEFLTKIKFGKYLEEIINTARPFFWLTSKDFKKIIKQIRKLDDRVFLAKKLYPMLVDHNKINIEIVREHLPCSEKKIIDDLAIEFPKPKDCFFGDLSGDTVFVIDLSGSMAFSFLYKKRHMTRLGLVKILFERAIDSLLDNQSFQIVTFSTKAKYIKGDENTLNLASKENKKTFIKKVLRLHSGIGPNRYTNISEGLRLALEIKKDFKRIVFLSDGGPTRGIWKFDELKEHILKLQENRVKMGFSKVPIHVDLMMLGGSENKKFRDNANRYAKMIASSTEGIIKRYDSKIKQKRNH